MFVFGYSLFSNLMNHKITDLINAHERGFVISVKLECPWSMIGVNISKIFPMTQKGVSSEMVLGD